MIILFRYIVLPAIILAAMFLARDDFRVKSDIRAFRSSLALAASVLVITLAYGIGGFMLMDESDFHVEISFPSAVHHTIDQFDLTTSQPLHPHTKRAKLFMDSLSFISTASVVFLVVSLVQPVRARFIDQSEQRKQIKALMDEYGAPSEDFFKLWPHDKHYFLTSANDSAIAYKVKAGVALILADPIGRQRSYSKLLQEFSELCWANDWQPALVHVDAKYRAIYESCGFQLQLIGQEAYVDVNHFCEVTTNNKYFRNIKNRFAKENLSFEILDPPHHDAVVDRLRQISDDWLSKPGRTERGLVMGYYNEEYIQQCSVAVVRDAAKSIQAFLNIVPSSSFNQSEVTYDMLRASLLAPPNSNDFLLCSLLHHLRANGQTSLSLGLSPLVGLDAPRADENLVSSVLHFAYTNGDRIYSFSGLHRFKSKYEPHWEDRYLGYRNGVRGFTKLLNSLLLAMRLPKKVRLKR
jgi:phosphatidylglycerol lysyltransferase